MDSKKDFLISLFGEQSCRFSEHRAGIDVLINNLELLNEVSICLTIVDNHDEIEGYILSRHKTFQFSHDNSCLTYSNLIIQSKDVCSWEDIMMILESK